MIDIIANPLLISLFGAFAFYFIWTGLMRRKENEAGRAALEVRLREFQSQSALSDSVMIADESVRRHKQTFMSRLGEQIALTALAGEGGRGLLDIIDDKLVKAGNPHGWQATDFVAYFVLVVGGTVLFGGLLASGGFPAYLYLPLVGMVAYYLWYDLTAKANARKEHAFFELPYFLDELIMSLSSGAGTLDNALKEVLFATEHLGLKQKERVLVREFRRAYQESSSQARPFSEAFRAASDRLEVQAVSDLVEVLVEGQKTGAPILHILRDMSGYVYQIFEGEMETLIKKKDTTFTIATVIMMFSTAIIIGTPIVLTVIEALAGQG